MITSLMSGYRRRMAQCAVGTMLAAASIGSAQATEEDEFLRDLPSVCAHENVAGVFGFSEETQSSPTVREPRAFVGVINLRPDGSAVLQKGGFMERGGEVRIGRVLEGRWTIEPHCIGFIDFPEVDASAGVPVEFDYLFVAVENATKLLLISNNPLEAFDARLLFRR
jgi:hypothetical protein